MQRKRIAPKLTKALSGYTPFQLRKGVKKSSSTMGSSYVRSRVAGLVKTNRSLATPSKGETRTSSLKKEHGLR